MFVPRPHLCDVLKREQRRLQLLCAPAGYGKTALLREYLRGDGAPGRVVWLGLGGLSQTLSSLSSRLAGELGLLPDITPDTLLAFFDRDWVPGSSP
jgi:LuxR family maltose regulon positive regulatory protein